MFSMDVPRVLHLGGTNRDVLAIHAESPAELGLAAGPKFIDGTHECVLVSVGSGPRMPRR